MWNITFFLWAYYSPFQNLFFRPFFAKRGWPRGRVPHTRRNPWTPWTFRSIPSIQRFSNFTRKGIIYRIYVPLSHHLLESFFQNTMLHNYVLSLQKKVWDGNIVNAYVCCYTLDVVTDYVPKGFSGIHNLLASLYKKERKKMIPFI